MGGKWPPEYGNYHGQSGAVADSNKINGYDDGYPATAPVNKSGRNDWGLYGVGGNVWECTTDKPTGSFDTWRGASWANYERDGLACSSGIDVVFDASSTTNRFGFRLLLAKP